MRAPPWIGVSIKDREGSADRRSGAAWTIRAALTREPSNPPIKEITMEASTFRPTQAPLRERYRETPIQPSSP
jgi:hypothetical protein